jgi:hypothetical protein
LNITEQYKNCFTKRPRRTWIYVDFAFQYNIFTSAFILDLTPWGRGVASPGDRKSLGPRKGD